MTKLWELTASEVARLIRTRAVSATDVAVAQLERLHEVNPRINAVVEVKPEEVLEHAGQIDLRLARGDDPGPMAGVVVTIKDSVERAGARLTLGLPSLANNVPQANSPLVDNLLRAGAVVLGTTNVPSFCYRWFTDNPIYGRTFNPRKHSVTPGGSSGGAGAGVAAGIGYVAHGGDIAGSIRYPAYACGVHGLRPSLGRVPSYDGTVSTRSIGSQLMATQGPLARSVDDLKLAFLAMSQPDMRDPWWTPVPYEGPALPKRIGYCLRPGGIDTDDILCKEIEVAARKLQARGFIVEPLDDVPHLREACALQVRLWMGDDYEGQLAAAREEGDTGAITALMGQAMTGRAIDMKAFSDTLRRRATLVSMWQQFLASYTAILLPVSAELPFPDQLDIGGESAYRRVWEAQLPMIGLPFMGLPGLSLCTGDEDGTPVGIQIVSNRFREDACLTIAALLEEDGRRPAVAKSVSL